LQGVFQRIAVDDAEAGAGVPSWTRHITGRYGAAIVLADIVLAVGDVAKNISGRPIQGRIEIADGLAETCIQ
jgi:hypothetical protein